MLTNNLENQGQKDSFKPETRFRDFLLLLRRSTDLLTDDPIRDEIFSVERLEEYAKFLASDLKSAVKVRKRRVLLTEVKRNGKNLLSNYLSLVEAIRRKMPVSPAAEWFVDNFHIVEDQLRQIQHDLPKNYYNELPKLTTGELQGYPRVYAMALAIIAHCDSRLEPDMLRRFLAAFQTVSPLTIGELWAFAITLRVALLSHLKPLATRVVDAREQRAQADQLADHVLTLASKTDTTSKDLVDAISRVLDRPQKFDRAYIVQLVQRIRDQDPNLQPAIEWLEGRLATYNTNLLHVIQLEHYRQATAQVTVGNIITSMRLLSAMDWKEFFESVSLVDRVLETDPEGTYKRLDFNTRDLYRHTIERLSRRSPYDELDIAERVIETTKTYPAKHPEDHRRSDLGYYLIDSGIRAIEKSINYRVPVRLRAARFFAMHPTFAYLGTLLLLTAAIFVPLTLHFLAGSTPVWVWIAFAILAFFPVSDFALSALNHIVTMVVPPKPLPKLETKDGIPEEGQTFVVVPTLFTSIAAVEELLENLQVHYLANRDPALYFALLGDFADAQLEHMPLDEAILNAAQLGIVGLNKRHCEPGEERFFLFHRKRLWNHCESKWMGLERKRGKIEEFNRLLRGAKDTTYIVNTAKDQLLQKIRYVITLDSDTQLPRGEARRLVGTILHPLNKPSFDDNTGRVTTGYSILQPRVGVSITSANRTNFAKIFSGHAGLDPYSNAVSEVYQDVFREGSYTGKGLYVVDAFEKALRNRIPNNTLLSHDLFEGLFARSALVADVELLDDFPHEYTVYTKRQHRWIRGDWQIAKWLLPRVPDALQKSVPNTLPVIARWKIFDNLRRSIVPSATLMCLWIAWFLLPQTAIWTGVILCTYVVPILASLYNSVLLHQIAIAWSVQVRRNWKSAKDQLLQIFVSIAFLPEHSWNHGDAIARTLYRMLFSKKNLLEWVTFAQTRSLTASRRNIWHEVGVGPYFSVFTAAGLIWLRPEALTSATPLLIVWIFNPYLKRWLRKRPHTKHRKLTATQIADLRLYARRTWHFFETFIGPDDHWLAPDNFQEEPTPVIAHRTSPTNMGLGLLAGISAYDFGYLGVTELASYLEKTFQTLKKLERYHGHFYNWYDTVTLQPLHPKYVSTVDSGNFAGHLVAIQQTCLSFTTKNLHNTHMIFGIQDTIRVLLEYTKRSDVLDILSDSTLIDRLESLLKDAAELIEAAQNKAPEDSSAWLERVHDCFFKARQILEAKPTEACSKELMHFMRWLDSASLQIQSFQNDEKLLKDTDEAARNQLLDRFSALALQCETTIREMDFKPLFDAKRKIFVIGLNAADGQKDQSYYDLMASESRLTSFIAIAKGDVSPEHWFRLGRQLTKVTGGRALVSWTGTMFEYLMPLLVMRRYPDTLLDETYESVVARQAQYGAQMGVPWGISEAGYNARDLQFNYQYGPFGIPGLGLKRGLRDDLVISPYSTMLASMIDAPAAHANLQALLSIGAYSSYGFYESIDYTPDRLPKDKTKFILRSYMAHHQGMSLVSLDNVINHNIMQKRFHNDPYVQATELLLQERVPPLAPIAKPRAEEVHADLSEHLSNDTRARVFTNIHLPTPRVQLLSNSTYSVMVTTTGAGYSRSGGTAVSRWREDATRDHWGQFIYLRNIQSGELWSAGYQPTKKQADKYEAVFAEDKVEIWRVDGSIGTHTEIIVSPEDDVELRRVSITNNSLDPADFEVTSFMETVLARQADDEAHPSFSNLFLQTEFVAQEKALLVTRRRRSKDEPQIWAFHAASILGTTLGEMQYETDRGKFIGRGRDASCPRVVCEGKALSNTVGAVLDPIFAIRKSVRIAPGETARILFSTGVQNSRSEALRLADKYRDVQIFTRENELSWTYSQAKLRHLNMDRSTAHLFQRLAGRILYSDPSIQPRARMLAQNSRNQSALWAYGISGDLPIVLAEIADQKDINAIRDLLHAHEYLRLKGLQFDLVILNERGPSYLQQLQDELVRQIRISGSQALLDKPGGVFMRRTDVMPPEDVILLKTVARIVWSADNGTLDEQIRRRPVAEPTVKSFVGSARKLTFSDRPIVNADLDFFNGLGGFTKDAREYVIVLNDGDWTPAPWINVLANSLNFGCHISESGSSSTWSVNSRENNLTQWSNDAVSDPSGDVIYIRDEDTGEFWSPTPLPVREKEPYLIRHGQGYTAFQHHSHGIEQDLHVFVPMDATVKISRLRLKNVDSKTRNLSVTGYVEWVLGRYRAASAPFILSRVDSTTGTILVQNRYNNEFASRVAFFDSSAENRSYTCNRKVFIGRNGSLADPAAMAHQELTGGLTAAIDPCAAIQTKITLEPGDTYDVVFLIGDAVSSQEASQIAMRFRNLDTVEKSLSEVQTFWDHTLTKIQVKTPDQAMDILINRWLIYQTLVCRVWARSAFYQAGGAFGFRDQLQDVMGLVYSHPKIAREQILRAASRQFKEGDVQHWWHPPTGRGVRTSFSDDLLWLPYVLCFYIKTTGDKSILNEEQSFIEAPLLDPGQESSYTLPLISHDDASLYEHCVRAIDRSLKVGVHGLPLMGCGDWNDGMNRVGHEGRGESVWVGWFLHHVLEQFIPLAAEKQDLERVNRYTAHQKQLKDAIEANGWDGEWYRRAYFDNGKVLGSASNDECRIDSIAQSWSVISAAGDPVRQAKAMDSLDRHLVKRNDGIIKLFDPPFDHSDLDPGYIKGYVPGVRENGGQYTHAAIWAIMAFAKMGDADKATELYRMINPIQHASTRSKMQRYKVEPYVIAADIYGMAPHIGRGGWTWYTGSSSWMYRSAIETILGLRIEENRLYLEPCIPSTWDSFELSYRHGGSNYFIRFENGTGKTRVEIDCKLLESPYIDLKDDGIDHNILISRI